MSGLEKLLLLVAGLLLILLGMALVAGSPKTPRKKQKGRHEAPASARRRKVEWHKVVSVLMILVGFAVVQECLFLMYLCIKNGYTSAAAWLTAAVGVGEGIVIAGGGYYFSLAKSDHKEGGITFETAKAKGFIEESAEDINSPSI